MSSKVPKNNCKSYRLSDNSNNKIDPGLCLSSLSATITRSLWPSLAGSPGLLEKVTSWPGCKEPGSHEGLSHVGCLGPGWSDSQLATGKTTPAMGLTGSQDRSGQTFNSVHYFYSTATYTIMKHSSILLCKYVLPKKDSCLGMKQKFQIGYDYILF